MSIPLIAITMGDPAGVGPEIVAKTFVDPDFQKFNRSIVIGNTVILKRVVDLLNLPLHVNIIDKPTDSLHKPGIIDAINVGKLPEDLPVGKLDKRAGAAAYDYVHRAIEFALLKNVDAIATAPLNKEALDLAGIKYPGHTEILAELTGTQDYAMMLVSDRLHVIHVSTHISLLKAITSLTIDRELVVIRLAHNTMQQLGILRPKIAVAGLNPHAGEGGLFGFEDKECILPAIEAAKLEGISVSGPWPPDTVFMKAQQGEFDIVIAQYHDQGHIPIKMFGFDTGVNVTVGLPFWRTSVDHGTAFDIAGLGKANPSSLRAAVDLATKLVLSKGF
jgi:4-hydroxythreonine-4-phosphate dehydrogenase